MEPKYFESLYPVNARDLEIEKIVGYIREGASCQIIGIPGSGRSNILGLLSYNKEVRFRHFPKHHADIHFVMTSFSEVRSRPLIDVMKFLFLSLSTSLRERSMNEEYEVVDRLFKESLSYNDELVLTQGLKSAVDYLAIEKKLTIIYLFDRFDEYVPMVTADFFTNLRAFRDRAKYRFSVVFSLARPLEDTIEPLLYTDFSDFVAGHHIYLPLYDEPGVTFRIAYLEKLTAKKLSSQVVEEILMLTGGHIRLIKLSVEALLAAETVPEDSISEFLLKQQTIQRALGSIWQQLTPAEQVAIRTISEGKKKEDEELSYLQAVGLVKNNEIQIPLLSAFLKSGVLAEDTSERIVYDKQTNTIKKGEILLSDSLTKAEFRFLAHLLLNQDRMVEREEIVQTVWNDEKSTAGVTEQAIDQLIFRLRRKIETDPNNPQHLVTVKGRGIKFTS